jgi:C1A family cysteine protease
MPLELSPAGRRYGARPSTPDHRDFGVLSIPGLKLAAPPPSDLHLAEFLGPVRDQGNEGSCTAHAGYAMRMLLANQFQANANKIQFSPEMLYYVERKIDGSLPEDAGSTGRTVCQALNRYGVCPDSDDPYDANPASVPSDKALADALAYKAGAYHALKTVADLKTCINSGYGFIVGFAVYESFESDGVAATGLMPVPNKTGESLLGGHEVFFWGYDDTVECPGAKSPGAFAVQNSWSPTWGAQIGSTPTRGHFWFPFECVSDTDIFFDAFIQHLGHAWR